MVICCIGTPKVKGDSLAPKIGDELIKSNINAFVYGTSQYPITAINYMTFYKMRGMKMIAWSLIL